MNSPISILLRSLRVQAGLTQIELAGLMGYEQAYVSAMELGLKPPSQEYLGRLSSAIGLGERDVEEMELARQESNRRFVLPAEVPTSTYQFCNALWARIGSIHPAVIDAMHKMLKVEDEIASRPRRKATRVRRKHKAEAPM
jgi:transcriptional regulator with XRE-family HTH domain